MSASLPLTAAQLGVWTAQQLDPLSPRYNCGSYLEIDGPVDPSLMHGAVRVALAGAEALRVSIGGQSQRVCSVPAAPLELVDTTGADDPIAAAEAWMRSDLSRPVDLRAGMPVRHALIGHKRGGCLLYLRYHHAVMDGFGQILHMRRIAEVYSALAAGEPVGASRAVPLAELVAEAESYNGSSAWQRDREHWLEAFADRPAPVSLSERTPATARSFLRRDQAIAEDDVVLLRRACDRLNARPATLLVAAVAAYQARITSSSRTLLNLPVAARATRAALGTPAMLANELPLRVATAPETTFAELVAHVGAELGALQRHQRYRGEDLQRELGLAGAGKPLAGTTVNVVTFDEELSFAALPSAAHHLSSGPVRDLQLDFFADASTSRLRLVIDANADLHTPAELAGHGTRLMTLLRSALDDPQRTLGSLELMEPAERLAVARAAAGPQRDYDLSRGLHELVEAQAVCTPGSVAVQMEHGSLTYHELVSRARSLAAFLRERGAGPGHVVGVHAQRSLELVVELLGVLMSGAAYLPLDPPAPRERLEFQLRDAGASMVLTAAGLADDLAGVGADVIVVDELLGALPACAELTSLNVPGDTAYVIYTSGSTGRPKGVAVSHRGVVNRLLWMQEELDLRRDDRVLQKTAFTFDVSVWEFFWPLIRGARLHLAEPGAHRDPRAMVDVVRRHAITTMHFVPPMLDLFLAEPGAAGLDSLRRVVCSGEALRPTTVGRFFEVFGDTARGPELHNLYGPTEASIDVTHWRCLPADATGPVPIGRPVANTSVYVLDPRGRPLPFDVPGELYIGGVQVASGYVNRAELTAERFVAGTAGEGVRYRTGDRTSVRRDGAVLYHGRLDDQVKVRGHRIEPGEIEAALLAHPSVAQAVVTAPERRDGGRELVAHVVAAGGASDTSDLLDALRDRLPDFMIPARIAMLDALPLLASGKVDRDALAAALPVARTARDASATAWASPDEALLQRVWSDLLEVDIPAPDISFFALGGDSMLAIRMRTAVERHGRTFTVGDLFERPTIRELARGLRQLEEGAATGTQPFELIASSDRALLEGDLEDAYPVSAMQAGMLYHSAIAERSSVYRVVTSVPVDAPLDLPALRAAVADTVRRHPSLRCSFDLTHFAEPLALVHRDVDVPVAIGDDLAPLDAPAQAQAIDEWVARAKFTRFDLKTPPLLHFTVHPRGAERFQLSVVEHHVVLDGWSDVRMLEEVLAHYRARRCGEELWLPAVASTYRDYVAAERRAVADPKAREYWAKLLAGVESTPLVPDRPTAADEAEAEAEADGASHRRFEVAIPEDVTARLRSLARQEGLPLKTVLVAAHLLVLRLVSGRDEVLTGVVANTRLEESGGDEAIGVFFNTLPLRVDLGELTLLDAAHRVLGEERRAAPHRRYPFAQMQRDFGEDLLIDSYVNYMDFGQESVGGVAGSVLSGIGVAETNFPLAVDFFVDPTSGALALWLEADLAVLSEELCVRLTGYYRRALDAFAADPAADAATVALLGTDELALVASWNATATPYDAASTVHATIEAQARRTPGATAVAHRWSELTYAQLDARANRLAHHLRATGVRRGDLVGVSLRRGTDLVVALLAVMKTGAAYVPLDISFPRLRLEDIVVDAGIAGLVTGRGGPDGIAAPWIVDVDAQAETIAARPARPPEVDIGGDDIAYVIYTSGTTGRPKGISIRHRNVVNFFAGMDQRVGVGSDDVVLALTSVSFDISVLELLWPLTRGAKVVVGDANIIANLVPRDDATERAASFSLFFFAASAGGAAADGYSLVLDAARFADTHGFEAIWTPERHFHEFGGLYPNPALMAAALATITENVALRCGSVVAPLHDSIRIAEEWSVVDNLSGGRVGLAFASGWNSNDFVFFPDRYASRKQSMADQLGEFRQLWRGEPVRRTGGSGETVDVRIYPTPVQAEPPIWLTSVGTVQTFRNAGAAGVNLLTHLLGQSPADLSEKIAAYRQARADHGHPGRGQVTVMVHTFMSADADDAKRRAREPFRSYLRSSTELWRTLFATTGQEFPATGAEQYLEAVIDQAIERYFETSGLFGSPETCVDLVRTLAGSGVDEIACLIDFGMGTAEALEGLTSIDRLRGAHEEETAEGRHSFAELCRRHRVTLVQGTPSLLSAVAAEPAAIESLAGARALLVGGEAFPSGLAQQLLRALPGVRVLNMYGPTETTIWSAVHELDRATDAAVSTIPIGRPIANTLVAVMDGHGRAAAIGVAGELWIGGDGVGVGYVGRPELTDERFVEHPRGGRFYRTGDRVRWTADGRLEFLGRLDRQVKILGHRVEPDEIESVLSRHPALESVAITAIAGAAGTELVAFVASAQAPADPAAQDAQVERWRDVWQDAYAPSGDGWHEFAGWRSSYTGDPIPEPEMREWLRHTIERVRELRPKAVADVGVGVGLLLRELVDHVDEYHGLDISASALSSAARCLGSGRDMPGHVRLVQSGPKYLEQLEPGSLDTVVINSVVQYFPGRDYLERVLAAAVRAVRSGGAVFVGDVRAVEMLPEFHTSVHLHRASPLQTVDEIRSTVARGVQDERELCLSPAFFTRLAGTLERVGEVRVELKRGRADNELTRFRYDVTIAVDASPRTAATPQEVRWEALPGGIDDIAERVSAAAGDLIVAAIPNARLAEPAAAVRTLAEMSGDATAWDLERQLWGLAESAAGVHPERLVDLGARLDRRVRLLVPASGRLDHFDAVFVRPEEQT